MKKALLLAAMAAAVMPAFAESEGVNYDAKDGYTFTNLWVNCAAKGQWNSLKENQIPSFDYIATATALGDKIYVASSKSFVPVVGEDGTPGMGLGDNGQLIEFDYNTGAYIRNIQLTVNGQPLTGLLCANHIGTDDFGHMYLFGYMASTFDTTNGVPRPLNIYVVDPATGACTLTATPALFDDSSYANGRLDHIDVIGDITRQQARCVVMAAPSDPADKRYLYAWAAEQGSDEFGGHLAGGDYEQLEVEECYPVSEGPWGGGAYVRILPDDEYSGSYVYIDTFTSLPTLYDTEAGMVASFADVVEADPENPVFTPKQNPNGACEFTLGDDTFFMYPYEEYEPAPAGNRARITRYGEAGDMSTLAHMYDFPQIGMGTEKGAGRRTHILQARVLTDSKGKQAAQILTYKCGNGLALYQLAQEGFGGGAGVEGIVVDNNAPVEYFNLQGIRVANPANGVYIRRQGNTVTKVIL